MAQLQISNLDFTYEGSSDPVFEDLSVMIDTSWKLGLIGRNGKGKTTLLRLLMGRYEYRGSIQRPTEFDYFPYEVRPEDLEKTAAELAERWKPAVEFWQISVQMNLIGMDQECLFRPFGTLSHGERTRVMLAVLFADENEFLLIDEPTNHLDSSAREIVKNYLAGKKGFLLVSHDRDLLDAVVDHVLVLNRKTIEVQAGNFTSWWENKEKNDAFALAENEKHKREIKKLHAAAERSAGWAEKNESTKIGFDPVKEPERNISTRSYIGAKTKKMQSRVKSFENRIEREIEEKEGLLSDIEQVKDLKIEPLSHHKELLIHADRMTLCYDEASPIVCNLSFEVRRGERVVLAGANGSGKSSIIAAILAAAGAGMEDEGRSCPNVCGTLETASGMVISYVNQDTSFLKGDLRAFCRERKLSESTLFAVLRHLDFERTQFGKDMREFSEGQKKKVLVAASLITPAHLYIWDEPLNFIDVFSRMQIEKMIKNFEPTMLLVEHDVRFHEEVATKIVNL